VSVVLQIAVGGALGAVLRYGAVTLGARVFGTTFPWGTLAVNVIGSFLIGVAFVYVLSRADPSLRRVAPLVMSGFLGGFTTFSAFSLETLLLIERGRLGAAMAYVGGSVALCLVAVAAGAWLARSGAPA